LLQKEGDVNFVKNLQDKKKNRGGKCTSPFIQDRGGGKRSRENIMALKGGGKERDHVPEKRGDHWMRGSAFVQVEAGESNIEGGEGGKS